jgi:hypothetical protein
MAKYYDIDTSVRINGDLNIPSNNFVIGGSVTANSIIIGSTNVATDLGLKALKATTISTGNGLLGGGDLSTNRTFSIDFGGNGVANQVARSDHNHDTIYAPISHSHAIANITNLQTTLDGKVDKTIPTVAGDLNTYATTGFYYVPTNTTNAPTTDSYTMFVIGNATNASQFLISGNTGAISYQRKSTDGGASWGSWYQILTSGIINQTPSSSTTSVLAPSAIFTLGFIDSNYSIAPSASAIDFNTQYANSVFKYLSGTFTNAPTGVTTPVYFYQARLNGTTDIMQHIWTHETTPRYFIRSKVGGTWNSWIQQNDWTTITNKPSTFTPSAHTHPISDVTNLQTTLNGKSDTTHNHDTTYLKLDGTNNMTGTLTINVGQTALALKASGTTDHVYMSFYADTDNPSVRSGWFGYSPAGSSTMSIKNEMSNGGLNFLTTGTGKVQANGNDIWHAGNDGTGSGLDADLLDGLDSTVFVRNNIANQSVSDNFTVGGNGNMFVGGSSSNGLLVVRSGTGTNGIQLNGTTGAKLTGVKSYIDYNGNAQFDGTVTINAMAITSTTVVTNLNAEMLNGLKEPAFAKNQSIVDSTGYGVYSGLAITAQAVPNMTVQVASGVVYTNSGMRASLNSQSVAITSASATYGRYDIVYIQGSSAGANEGKVTVATGTPSATPVDPTVPSDGVKLARIFVPQNIGSIQSIHITDLRQYIPVKYDTSVTAFYTSKHVSDTYSSNASTAYFDKPLRLPSANKSITITAGQTTSTWTHNLNLTNYIVKISCNNPEPHVYWSNKTANAITINLDDICDLDTIIDIGLEAY